MWGYEGNCGLRESGKVDRCRGGEVGMEDGGMEAGGGGTHSVPYKCKGNSLSFSRENDFGSMSLSMVQGSSWLEQIIILRKLPSTSKHWGKAVVWFFVILLKISLKSYIRIKINVRLFYFYMLYFLSKQKTFSWKLYMLLISAIKVSEDNFQFLII